MMQPHCGVQQELVMNPVFHSVFQAVVHRVFHVLRKGKTLHTFLRRVAIFRRECSRDNSVPFYYSAPGRKREQKRDILKA